MKARLPVNEILKLKSEGKTYIQIGKILNLKPASVYYYWKDGQKEVSRLKTAKRRKNNPFINRINRFCTNEEYNMMKDAPRSVRRILSKKRETFSLVKIMRKTTYTLPTFTVDDVKEKIGDNPVCYLTGRPIDLTKSREYEFDHIIPRKKRRIK